jgi:hypothetical protein
LWKFLGVDTQNPQLRDLLETELGSNPDRDWQQKKAKDLIGPLEKGKTGSWRDLFTERDRDVFREVAGDTLAAWQYSW